MLRVSNFLMPSTLMAFVLAIVGCASNPTEAEPTFLPAPEPSSNDGRFPASYEPGYFVLARGILHASEVPKDGYGAYGYLILTHRSTEPFPARAFHACIAYLFALDSLDEFSSVSTQKVIPTFWLSKDGTNKKSGDCGALVDGYDYARAKLIASSVGRLSSRGPILVAWPRKPFEKSSDRGQALVLDLSKLEITEFDSAVRLWSSKVAQNPELWNRGFDVSEIRLIFRSFVNQYGDSFVELVEWFKNVVS